jgi:hypothetical protein
MKTSILLSKTTLVAALVVCGSAQAQDLISLNVGTTLPSYTYEPSSKEITAQMTVRNVGFFNSTAFDVALFLKNSNTSTEYEIDRTNYSGLSYNQLGNANTLYITNWIVDLDDKPAVPGGTYRLIARINDNQNAFETNFTNNQENFGNLSFVYASASVGIQENKSDLHSTIFPNPTNGIFRVEFSDAQLVNTEVKFEIYNVVGGKIDSFSRLVSQPFVDVDLTNQPKGVYFLKIENGSKDTIKKIVVQ